MSSTVCNERSQHGDDESGLRSRAVSRTSPRTTVSRGALCGPSLPGRPCA